MANDDQAVENLADEISRYLAEHPDAADSVEGIRLWWLARQRYEDTAIKVQKALDRLIDRGAAVKTVLPDGTTVYGRP